MKKKKTLLNEAEVFSFMRLSGLKDLAPVFVSEQFAAMKEEEEEMDDLPLDLDAAEEEAETDEVDEFDPDSDDDVEELVAAIADAITKVTNKKVTAEREDEDDEELDDMEAPEVDVDDDELEGDDEELALEAYDELDFATDAARKRYRHGREELEIGKDGQVRAVGDRPEFLVGDMDDEVDPEQLADELGISVRDLEGDEEELALEGGDAMSIADLLNKPATAKGGTRRPRRRPRPAPEVPKGPGTVVGEEKHAEPCECGTPGCDCAEKDKREVEFGLPVMKKGPAGKKRGRKEPRKYTTMGAGGAARTRLKESTKKEIAALVVEALLEKLAKQKAE